jgi:type II secretory pathway pseudopilin PulG
MPKMTASNRTPRKDRLASFSLVELLVVMAIILILVGLVLYAAEGVWNNAARGRASGEIQAMSSALDNYKTDNGTYPTVDVATGFTMSSSTLLTNSSASPYSSQTVDGTSAAYKNTSQLLYLALSGQTNFSGTPVAGVKVYMTFKQNQIGDPTGAVSGGTYIQDPWQYSYGYSLGNAASYPFSGNGFFDLWSTGGLTSPGATNINAWVANWR